MPQDYSLPNQPSQDGQQQQSGYNPPTQQARPSSQPNYQPQTSIPEYDIDED